MTNLGCMSLQVKSGFWRSLGRDWEVTGTWPGGIRDVHWKSVEICLGAMVGLGAPNPTIALGTSSDQVPKGMVHFGAPHRTIAFRKIGDPF